jgi:hypothetical protein
MTQASAMGRGGCCTLSLSFMHRLHQTEKAVFMLFCCVASEGSLFYQKFIHHNSRCQVLCGSRKRCPEIHFNVVIFSGSSNLLSPALLSVESWVPLKPVLGGVKDEELFFIIPHVQIQSNRICNFHVILLYLLLRWITSLPDDLVIFLLKCHRSVCYIWKFIFRTLGIFAYKFCRTKLFGSQKCCSIST